jgi:hypothetical protein
MCEIFGRIERMPNDWVADHEWHDVRYQDLPDWVKRRVKDLNHRQLVGKTFVYRREELIEKAGIILHQFRMGR